MRTYGEHRRQQHAIQRLRPALDRPEAPRPPAAAVPSSAAAPLPPRPVAPETSYEAQRVDDRRRIAVGVARRLGWQPGDGVTVRRDEQGCLTLERLAGTADEDRAEHTAELDRQRRIRLTPALLAAVGGETGSQLLLRVCERTKTVQLVPLSWLEQLFSPASDETDMEAA